MGGGTKERHGLKRPKERQNEWKSTNAQPEKRRIKEMEKGRKRESERERERERSSRNECWPSGRAVSSYRVLLGDGATKSAIDGEAKTTAVETVDWLFTPCLFRDLRHANYRPFVRLLLLLLLLLLRVRSDERMEGLASIQALVVSPFRSLLSYVFLSCLYHSAVVFVRGIDVCIDV